MITLIRKVPLLLSLLCITQPALSNDQEPPAVKDADLLRIPAAQTQSVTTAGTSINKARRDELRYMVQQDCGSCHGMTLKGGLGPSLLPERISALPDQYLYDAIFHGRKGTPMPPWASILKTEEIHWIVEQLKLGQLAQIPNKTNDNNNVSGKN